MTRQPSLRDHAPPRQIRRIRRTQRQTTAGQRLIMHRITLKRFTTCKSSSLSSFVKKNLIGNWTVCRSTPTVAGYATVLSTSTTSATAPPLIASSSTQTAKGYSEHGTTPIRLNLANLCRTAANPTATTCSASLVGYVATSTRTLTTFRRAQVRSPTGPVTRCRRVPSTTGICRSSSASRSTNTTRSSLVQGPTTSSIMPSTRRERSITSTRPRTTTYIN